MYDGKKNSGIILKNFDTNRYKYSLFDSSKGKIDSFIKDYKYPIGSLISYTLQEKNNYFFCLNVQLLYVPFHVDIWFLHLLLELCFYFLNDCQPSCLSFDILRYVYKNNNCEKQQQKIIIFKLLVSFGLYQNIEPLSDFIFHYLASESIDTIFSRTLDLETENKIKIWIDNVLMDHPYFSNFKTVNYIKKNRLL